MDQLITQAILDQVNSGLLHNYVFPSEERAQLAERLVQLAPKGLDKVVRKTSIQSDVAPIRTSATEMEFEVLVRPKQRVTLQLEVCCNTEAARTSIG